MVLRLSLVLAASASLVPGAVRAQCTETSVSDAVGMSDCTRPGLRWVVVTADLPAVDVGVRVSRPDERAKTVEDWASTVTNTLVAVQGGPFAFPTYAPIGFTVGDGIAWEDGEDDALRSVIAFDARSAPYVPPAEQLVDEREWMHDVVSGVPVVRAGAVVSPCRGQGCERMPRTAIGLANEGRTLVIVVAEGWTMNSAGVTDPELGELARDAGATSALRTGEGATSVLWAGGGLAVPSSDGATRPTAAFFAVVDRTTGETARLRGVAEANEPGMPPLPGAHIRVETIDGTLVAEGAPLTMMGYFEYTLPLRDYFVIVSHDGYRTGCKYCPLTMHEMGEMWCSAFLTAGTGMETCMAPAFAVDPGGDWPVGSPDAGPEDAGNGPDAGRRPPVEPGCSVGPTPLSAPLFGPFVVIALALVLRRKVLSVS